MRALHLTFDDGPHPDLTPRVLDALARRRARATFFVLGRHVRETPYLVHEILARGHRVELHGDAHLDHRSATATALRDDTHAGLRALSDLDVVARWWRLPWGRRGPYTSVIAERAGLAIAGWNADTHDWRGDGWREQPRAVVDAAAHGGVVLLHDGFGPGQARADGDNTLELVDELLDTAHAHGTPVRALPDAGSWDAAEVTDRAGTMPRDPAAA